MKPHNDPPEDAADPEIDNAEIVEAAQETEAVNVEPEVAPGTENMVAWDESPESSGHAAPKVPMEDEVAPGEQLVYEGLEEADREQRIAAADPDFTP